MKYEITLPAAAGDVAPIGAVADAMALRDATAGGHDPLPLTRAGRFGRYLAMLLTNVRSGKLPVCDDIGEPWDEPEALVRDRTADGEGPVVLHPDLITVNVDATWAVNVFVKLGVLNKWAAQRGDEFTVSHNGVPWIEADFWVSQGGESHFDVRQRGAASELGQRSAIDAAEPAMPAHQYRQPAQEAAILAKLAELGFNAQALPMTPAGKPSLAKQAAREALSYSVDVMNKAWQRLRSAGLIREA